MSLRLSDLRGHSVFSQLSVMLAVCCWEHPQGWWGMPMRGGEQGKPIASLGTMVNQGMFVLSRGMSTS